MIDSYIFVLVLQLLNISISAYTIIYNSGAHLYVLYILI